jgi:hypothetical protein
MMREDHMKWRRPPLFRLVALTGVLCALLLAGCGGDGRIQLSGRVTFDGQPIDQGTIDFLPADGQGPTAGGLIEGGRYSVRVAPGMKRVEIQGFREIGREKVVDFDPDSPVVPITQPFVPAQYNTESTLSFDAQHGTATADFDLPP